MKRVVKYWKYDDDNFLGLSGYKITVYFESGERMKMFLKTEDIIKYDEQYNFNKYVHDAVAKALKQEKIDKIKSILYDDY